MADFYYNSKDILDKAMGTDAYFQIKSILTGMKAADVVEVRHGRWIGEPVDIGGSTAMECSECHKVRVVDEYCSACGALMDGKEDEHGRM